MQSEKMYRLLVENIPDVVWTRDQNGNTIYISPCVEKVYGYTPEEVYEDKAGEYLWFGRIHPDDVGNVKEAYELLFKSNKKFDIEHRIQRKDGNWIWLHDRAMTTYKKDGVIYADGIFTDITGRKHIELELKARLAQQAIVTEIGQHALSVTALFALMNEVVNTVAKTLDVELCRVLELLPNGNTLLLRAGVGWKEGLVGHATVDAKAHSQAGYTLLSHEPVILEDLRTETRFIAPRLLLDHGVVSGMSVIIHGRHRPFGVLCAHTTRRRTFTKDDIEFLQACANILAMSHERNLAVESLQKSNACLAEAQQIAHIGCWERDIVKNKVFWSDEVYRIFDLSMGEFGAAYEAFLNYVHPNDREFVQKSIDDAIHERKPHDIEFRIIRKDTTVRIVHGKGEVAFDDTGKAIRMAGTIQDITERKRVEEEINLLQTITMTIAKAEDCHAALESVVRKVCESTGWAYGEVWQPSHDGKYLECWLTWHGSSEELREFGRKSKEFTFSPGIGMIGRVWSSKKPEWRKDATIDGDFPRADITKASGLREAMGIPVVVNDEVVAILCFFARERRDEDERLIKLVSSIAAQLGVVIKRKLVENLLRESEARLHAILENTPAVVCIKDLQGRYIFVNRQGENLLRIKKNEIVGKTPYDYLPEDIAETHLVNDRKVINAKIPKVFDEVAVHDDGEHSYISVKFPLFDSSGDMYAVCGISTDITERKRIEEEREKLREQLYHAQKLESLGNLAGGFAHYFNNLLTVIIGYTSLLQMELKEDDFVARDFIQRILKSAESAAQLTRDILAFSRKQPSNPKPINLNDIIKKSKQFLSKVIRKDIKLETTLTDIDCTVMADSSQIEQVLMNLATNAVDAMPDGGLFTISTDIIKIGEAFIRTHGYGEPGIYAIISVSDTGVGMSDEIQRRIFEPFFTTKEVGKGTGLGLAIVYGIIKQHKGYISVDSKPGKGTTFKIYLPLIEPITDTPKAKIRTTLEGSARTVFIAEDDAEIRNLIKITLEGHGYNVIEAVDGEDAINKFAENKDKIQVLVFDVIMPAMNGKEAYEEIKKMKPDIKVLFMSGYSDDIIHKKGIFKEELNYILKPVLPLELLSKVREVLDK